MPFPMGIVKPKRTTIIRKNCIYCGNSFILHKRKCGKILRRRPWKLDNEHCTIKCMEKHLGESK